MSYIDLNSDAGESLGMWRMGDDASMFRYTSSANIACGFHAGDPTGIARTCREAAGAGLSIGAHVAYRDLVGFGRRFLDCSVTELADDVLYQLGALQALARSVGSGIRYVKPHGALYNVIVNHELHARAVVDAICAFDMALPLLTLPGSFAGKYAAGRGLEVRTEAFADRAYNSDGTLVPRREQGAVLTDLSEVAGNMVTLATEGKLISREGATLNVAADSICLHGDTPNAVPMAAAVRQALDNAGVTVRSFA
jgi:UPF0271 protein